MNIHKYLGFEWRLRSRNMLKKMKTCVFVAFVDEQYENEKKIQLAFDLFDKESII